MTPLDCRIVESFHGMKDEQKKRLLAYLDTLLQLEQLEDINNPKE